MKIAILTSFKSMPESYSLVNDVKDRIKTLVRYGHEVVFFAQEGCKGEGIVCEMKAILPHVKLDRDVVNEEGKNKIIEVLFKELKEFDLVFTDDMMYIRQYVTYREAIFVIAKQLPGLKWAHWVHSRIAENLNLKMPNAKYIYMNYAHQKDFANHMNIDVNDVHVIFNDKDPRIFFEFHSITKKLIDKYDLLDYEIMQSYPLCTTRMDAKGINHVIDIFAEIKKRGRKVKLIIANSNGHKLEWQQKIEDKYKYAENKGLVRDVDFVFSSQLGNETINGVPRAVVRDLFLLSNLFIFPSTSEVCSNVLLEASMTKNLIVLNKDFVPFFDFGEEDKSVLGYNFGSTQKFSITSGGISKLVDNILQELDNNKANQQFLRIKNDTNVDTLYNKQFKPLLEWAKTN